MPRAFILLQDYHDVEDYGKQFGAGNSPDETPYGLHHGRDCEFEVSFSRPTPRTIPNKIMRRLFGFQVGHILNNAELIDRADVVWTVMEREFMGVLLAARIGRLKRTPKMIGQAIWIFDKWDSLSSVRRGFYRALISNLSVLPSTPTSISHS